MSKITFEWQVEVITPVHIGVAQEKFLQEGIDFIIDNGKIYVLDQRKVIDKFGVDRYTQLVINNQLKDQVSADVHNLSTREQNFAGWTRELRPMIKNTLTGKPYIPGTSMKGAIRSALFGYFAESLRPRQERDVFGGISDDIFKFIQVSDVLFDNTKLYNSKIYNLKASQGQFHSVWKNKGGKFSESSSRFNPNKFTTGFECIVPGEKGRIKITFDNDRFLRNRHTINPDRNNVLFNSDFEDNLFTIIGEKSKAYLEKESEFFTTYQDTDDTEEVANSFEIDVENLTQEGLVPLKLAHGSGFHAMTGDWKLNDHLIDGIRQQRGMRNGIKSSKTRKLLFEWNRENNMNYFYNMGYITLRKI